MGDRPDGWDEAPLGKRTTWLSGGTPSKSNPTFWAGDIPWVSPKDMKVFRLSTSQDSITPTAVSAGSRLAPENAILLVVRGMILAHTFPVCLTTRPVAFNQDVKAVLPSADIDATYLAHWFTANQERMLNLVTEATHGTKRIDLQDLLGFQLNYPALPEQQEIAKILDTLDETIHKTEQVIAKLRQMKQGLLHDLLTRGVDENGELRDPERFPEQFKDSELGRLPRGWEVQRLSKIAEVRSGVAKNTNKTVSDPVAVNYLRVANVQDGYLDLSEVSQLTISKGDLERYSVLPGDVLMNEGGDLDKLGRGTVWRGQLTPCIHQNHVFVVRCGSSLDPEYLNAWTSASSARRYFLVAGKQTTNLASINKNAIGQLPVAIPPKAEQTAIVQALATLDGQVSSEGNRLSKLQTLKKGLMHDLLTGRVRTRPEP